MGVLVSQLQNSGQYDGADGARTTLTAPAQ
jgi:hypothetical protein